MKHCYFPDYIGFWGGYFSALKGRQHTSPGQRPGLTITITMI